MLVVDDERAVRELLRKTLLLDGYDVIVASGGADGLRTLATDPDVALVLLDLDMPHIDGFQFRAAQLEDPRLAAVPVAVISGTRIDDELRATLGAAAYVSKPFSRRQLLEVVGTHCRRVGDAFLPLSHPKGSSDPA